MPPILDPSERRRGSLALPRDVPVGIFRLTPDGRFRTANRAALALLGRKDPEALRGTRAEDVVADGGDVAAWIERIRAGAERLAGEVRVKHAGGGTRVTRVGLHVARTRGGALAGFEGWALDVTERSLLLEERERSRGLEAIGRLARGVAHDFNNLLSVVGANAELVLAGARIDEEARAHLAEIVEASRRGAGLAAEILRVGRTTAPSERPLDVNRHLLDMERLLARALGEPRTLRIELADDAGCARIAPAHLDRILLNFVVNARDAMPGGGTLSLGTGRTARVPTSARRPRPAGPGPWVTLTVRDTGHGIPEEVAARIFDPLFTTKGAGGGLGLATVRELVEGTGGSVTVAGRPGRGATFRVYLPCAGAPHRGAELARDALVGGASHSDGRRATILLVEDERPVRLIVERILRDAGYRVLSAASAAEARRRVEEEDGALDLLFADIVLPGGTGSGLAEWALARCPHVRVLFTSGYSFGDVARLGSSPVHAPFLPKPFTREQVLDGVRRALEGGRTDARDGGVA